MCDDREGAIRQIYHEAVMGLPAPTRTIFLQHRADGEDLVTIAARHGLSADDVAAHIANALIAIDRALLAAGH